jgi:undecaprenyl pyrophosphate phosphatase UppP
MKIIYTESGRQALEVYKQQQVQELEERVASFKYVFGDDVIEITAADVKQATDVRNAFPRTLSRRSTAHTILISYIIMGLLMSIVGLFYEQLIDLFHRNPIQLALVLGGVSLSIVSYAMLQRFRERDLEIQRMEQIERFEKEIKRNL